MRLLVFALVSFALLAQDLTVAKREEVGAAIAGEIASKTTPIASGFVQGYLNRLGARLAAQMNSPFPYSFLAVTDQLSREMHEPLAVPGGHNFVSAVLILASKNESEFAGMLAQAMEQRPLPPRSNAGTIPLILIGGMEPNALTPVSALAELRQMNLDADRAAVTALARAEIDPHGLLNYIDREQRDDRFSGLPDRATRIAALQSAIGDRPPANYQESGDFARVQQESRPAPRKPPTLRNH